MKLYEFFSVPSIEKDEEGQSEKMSDENREQLANDLYWYILDHDKLHKEHFIPIAQKINRDLKSKKKIDRDALRLEWMPMVEAGCLAFHKEHKMQGRPSKLFDKEFCKELCERLSDNYLEDIRKDEYKLGE
jgi:hypothetical protein